MSAQDTTDLTDEIAIVGMAGRFPGSSNLDAFWANLQNGVESIRTFSDDELLEAGVEKSRLDNPHYVKRGSFVDGADKFDTAFFGFTPREAQITDPQHRLFLECAWEALENSGYESEAYQGLIGLFAGCGASNYLRLNLLSNPGLWDSVGDMLGIIGNDKNYMTTRASYLLNLTGPSLGIQSACSTSLVAVQVACLNLQNYLCDMALCGGSYINLPRKSGYLYNEGEIFSPDGRCRAFDAEAHGTIFGEGAGVVVLKRLEDALEDNDTIHAVIKGIAVNNDGAQKIGYTAPSVQRQADVISMAHALAGVSPETISYIEAHGTGTPMGDPIEIAALKKAFSACTDKKAFCAVGSIKSNIGHLDAAAGVAGLIKTVLSLKNRQIPPTLYCKTLNPKLEIENSPFFINTALSEWSANAEPRRAGVSSFGVGGTNAHAVLEEAPQAEPTGSGKEWQILPLSAKTDSALDTAVENMAEHLRKTTDLSLADTAWTLQVGRKAFEQRRIVLCQNREDALDALEKKETSRLWTARAKAGGRPFVFMFTGQGAQYPNMARGLYETEPVFRENIDRCADLLLPALGMDIRDVLYPSDDGVEEAAEKLAQTHITQPALFTIEYALAKMLLEWMPPPQAMIGHSIGEYVAACLSGVFSLEDALHLVAERGRLMGSQSTGAMTSVPLSEEETLSFLSEGAEIAVVNGPTSCVVSGSVERIEELESSLGEKDILFRRLRTSHAFHSVMMGPAVKPFEEKVRQIQRNKPTIPFLSNVTGTWITDDQAVDPAYWASHIRKAVRFSDGLRETLKNPDLGFLEVGPGNSLCTLVRQHGKECASRPIIFPVRHPSAPQPDTKVLMAAVGKLWLAGAQINWSALHGTERRRRRIPLPTYPFERKRCWIDPPPPNENIPESFSETEAEPGKDESSKDTKYSSTKALLTSTDEPTSPSEIETALLTIWQNLLGVEQPDIHDDFFELGGHSLLASQVIARISDSLGTNISLPDFFNNPTIAGLAKHIVPIQDGESVTTPSQNIPLVPRNENLLLSPAQQRIWFLHQLEPQSPAFNIIMSLRLTGDLNLKVLEQSLNAIIARHELLRTTFRVEEGTPSLIIAPEGSVFIEQLQPTHEEIVPNTKDYFREEAAHQRIVQIAPTPFDLEKGPLLRPLLLPLAEKEYLFAFVIHHIISDGWSMGVFLRELGALYESIDDGKPSPLPDLPCQYADYALWKNNRLETQALEDQIGYWKQKLSGTLPLLQLPTDRPRPVEPSNVGRLKKFVLLEDLTEDLHKLSQREGVTLFMTLMAAFQTLLHRYSGQDDVIVGAPIANRHPMETESLIGFFLNTLPVRSDLSGQISFQKLLSQVRHSVLEGFQHQDLPFERLVDALQPSRELNHHPIFQTIFAFQNFPLSPVELSNLTMHPEFFDRGASQLDLTLYMWEEAGQLIGALEYDSELFDSTTVNRMVRHFQTLLESVANEPSGLLDEIPLLMASEREALSQEWRSTDVPYGKDTRVHRLLEAQVDQTPDAPCLTFEETTLTYREMNERANRLARHLRRHGIAPGDFVGIFVERSIEAFVAFWGVLKSGGAYVPLDPEYPAARLSFMIENSKIKLILTQKHLENKLSAQCPAQVVRLDADWQTISKEEPSNLQGGARTNDPAYLIYTSGSTGEPKGVVNEHCGICNQLLWMRDQYPLTQADSVLQKTPFSFDVSVWEYFWPMLCGARLVVAPPESHRDSMELIGLIQKEKITTIHFVPSMLHVFLDNENSVKCQTLKRVICSGEALAYELQELFFSRFDAELLNLYGPTEAAVHVTYWRCQQGDERRIVPIGRPVANTRMYVLDSHNQPVPIGVVGKLYIGGIQVARGYMNRPSLTEEKFLSDPFIKEPGARLYETGDLARTLSDGTIEYLGRADHQVKISGFRIELGEIEARLDQYPSIRQSVVTVRDVSPGDQRLVAYYVPNQLSSPKKEEIRAFLKDILPDYMIPSLFVSIEEFPLTSSGKVDRKVLPQPDLDTRDSQQEHVAPRDELEIQLVNLWEKLLGVKSISIRDNYFDLGGNSLLAARLFAQIEKTFDRSLPLALLFRAPTIEQMAETIREKDWKSTWSSLVPIQTGGSKPPLFLVHGAEGNVLIYRALARALEQDYPVYGLQAKGLNGCREIRLHIETMASHYIEEIRSLQPEGPYHLGGYCMGGAIAFEMAQQLHAQGQETALLAMFETYNIQSVENHLLPYGPLHLFQNIQYHVENILSIHSRDRKAFLLQKSRVSKSRFTLRSSIMLSRIMRKIDFSNALNYPHIQIDKANDQAHCRYNPQPYPGRIVLFRPKKHFFGYTDPKFGWDGMAEKGVDVHVLPISPKGIMVEPFVELLAEKLKPYLKEEESPSCSAKDCGKD